MTRLGRLLGAVSLAGLVTASLAAPGNGTDSDWRVYGGESGRRYSALDQINRSNVAQLAVAWRFDTGEGLLQTSPLVVGRTLFGYTPEQKAFALDAATGAVLWRFDPGSVSGQPARGMTYWARGRERRLRQQPFLPVGA